MKASKPRSPVVDWLAGTIRQVFQQAQDWFLTSRGLQSLEPQAPSLNHLGLVPTDYLRLAMTMDLCFMDGQLPEINRLPFVHGAFGR